MDLIGKNRSIPKPPNLRGHVGRSSKPPEPASPAFQPVVQGPGFPVASSEAIRRSEDQDHLLPLYQQKDFSGSCHSSEMLSATYAPSSEHFGF